MASRIEKCSRGLVIVTLLICTLENSEGFHPALGRLPCLSPLHGNSRRPEVTGFRNTAPRTRRRQTAPSTGEAPLSSAEEEVPATMERAIQRFFLGKDHSPRILVGAVMAMAVSRAAMALVPGGETFDHLDLLVLALVCQFWMFQEWWLHKYLLHSFKWWGQEYHHQHHLLDYYYVSIDPVWLVVSWFLAAFGLFYLLLPTDLCLSATFAYSAMGLLYEFCHYLAHTKVMPKNRLLRAIKLHHMKHHFVDEDSWFAFSGLYIDSLLKTAPSGEELVKIRNARRRMDT
uniref:Fatty acid hydroxylase domain-containing protein n=2 Tax=Guillardia theta TaxID=55529 RepID=A0A7S4L3W6_GUITH|mmetsp:Transcript_36379/g.113394  ORF Transcript_36379/g.113394 Transcript_36379/m.113394 type:complete len:287 (+) Transcript_36379:174-1034(+)